MEDLQRDLGRLKRIHSKSPPTADVPREEWSLLLVGNQGRLLRLHLGWGLLLALVVVVMLFLVGMGLWRISHWEWRRADGADPRLQEEVEKLRRENQRLMARLAALEIVQETAVSAAMASPAPTGMEAEGEDAVEPLENPEQEKRPEISPETLSFKVPPAVETPMQKVAMDGYAAGIRDGEYRLSFNIRNLVNDTAVSGYIVSVLLSENPEIPPVASPAMAVQDGRPMEPQRGQFFSIRRFKDVRLRFGNIDIRPFRTNRIFIFNEAGVLLHVEDFDVLASS